MGTIRVGVAGWDYPDWWGIVYPPRVQGRFDKLAWLSRFVDVVEINSTFYRPCAPHVSEQWLVRCRDRPAFRFTAKAHRDCTHGDASVVDPAAALARTLAGLAPLRQAARLGALLLQFPQSFHFDDGSRERLARLLEGAEGWPLVVEVRHRSWDDPAARNWLAERGTGLCAVDQPFAGRATLRRMPVVVGRVGYLRLHGRNAGNWFRKEAGRDARYDYLYAPAELDEVAADARIMAGRAESLFVVQNNHFRGQALANALELRGRLEHEPPPAPAELVVAYPRLAGTVRVDQQRLF